MRMTTEKQTKTADEATRRRVVLVGTYRGGQLKDWPGWYCWPIEVESRKSKVESPTAGGSPAAAISHGAAERNAQSPQRSQGESAPNESLCVSAPPREETPSRTLRTSREAIPEWLPCGVDYGRKLKETA